MNTTEAKSYFSGKKITVMGLGLLGRGIGDIQFLSDLGADLIVTDLKDEKELAPALEELKTYKDIEYHLGGHKKEDFQNTDMILKAAGVPLDSLFIEEAIAHGVSVCMSASLVASLTSATIIGVTGTRGKSTVTRLIYHILQKQNRVVHLAGNVRGIATLSVLEHVSKDDIIVMELDSWQLQGFGDAEISPHTSVFTNFYSDHMDYYSDDMQQYFDDKANIFKYQKEKDTLIVSSQAKEKIDQYYSGSIQSSVIVVTPLSIHNPRLVGDHNEYNAACAFEVAKKFGIDTELILSSIESFEGVEGRLQFVRSVDGVSIYNDNNATSPEATIAGLRAVSSGKNVVLIIGGHDKCLNMKELLAEILKYCKGIVLYPGTGTELISDQIKIMDNVVVEEGKTLKECVRLAQGMTEDGDVLLYSPAFSSFGHEFKNEYDRNDQFMKIIESL